MSHGSRRRSWPPGVLRYLRLHIVWQLQVHFSKDALNAVLRIGLTLHFQPVYVHFLLQQHPRSIPTYDSALLWHIWWSLLAGHKLVLHYAKFHINSFFTFGNTEGWAIPESKCMPIMAGKEKGCAQIDPSSRRALNHQLTIEKSKGVHFAKFI